MQSGPARVRFFAVCQMFRVAAGMSHTAQLSKRLETREITGGEGGIRTPDRAFDPITV